MPASLQYSPRTWWESLLTLCFGLIPSWRIAYRSPTFSLTLPRPSPAGPDGKAKRRSPYQPNPRTRQTEAAKYGKNSLCDSAHKQPGQST